jgi:hypothetical protein
MADGLGRVPIKAEVAAADGEIGGDSQFFAGTRTEQCAVVADPKAKDAAGLPSCAAADIPQQGNFALLAAARHGIDPLQ